MEAHPIGKTSTRAEHAHRRLRSGGRRPSRLRRAWSRVRAFEREWSVAGPALFASLAAALLIYNHVQKTVTDLVFWLGLALLGAVFTWLVQNNHRRARVDAVTGLANRLELSHDLSEVLKDSDEPQVLVLLSSRASPTTATASASGPATSCSAASLAGSPTSSPAWRAGPIASTAASSAPWSPPTTVRRTKSRRQSSSRVAMARAAPRASWAEAHGVVTLPDDATDTDEALRLAGQRLAEDRRRLRESAKHQAHDTLMAILSKRHPEMVPHLRAVAYHVLSLGRRLGLSREQLDDVVFAARLQHVGMLSVPDAAIESQSHLPASESILLRDLPGAGAEIIASAPALASVAKLVRSSHENYDGTGYPDALAGDRIPLGSRILSVCVSYVVLTSKREDQRPLSENEALAELRRDAGKQFDPRVVEVLAEDLAEDS